jgi:hypothetical protein
MRTGIDFGRLWMHVLSAGSVVLLAACGGGSAGGGGAASAANPAATAMQAQAAVAAGHGAASSGEVLAKPAAAGAAGFQTVPQATCGAGDSPETGLQGQVPAALRAAGFKGFSCNLKLVGQVRGDGANWQSTEYKDSVHKCAYHGTSYSTVNRTQLGVPVIDVTTPSSPTVTGYLTTSSMLDPWESLKVNERRQLLGADQGNNGGFGGVNGGGPGIDIYDVGSDCRYPQLLASVDVGNVNGSTGIPVTVYGHEGTWAPDGLTYYGGDLADKQYYAVDTTIPTKPKLISAWLPAVVAPIGASTNTHGMSISDDGTRGYFVSLGNSPLTGLTDPAIFAVNGLLIYDLTDIQNRKGSNPQPRLISHLFWKDGSTAQHTINVQIKGKPYVIFVDEGGSGATSSAEQEVAACAASMPPFPMARIIDISDEKHPFIASRLALQVHDPANCATVLPDITGLSVFTYGSHYCSVDNRHDATTLVCGYFNSGIRVFDIRKPTAPREIAYYNPAGTTTASPGSNHIGPLVGTQWVSGGPDWCSAQAHLDATEGVLWTTCQDNGLLVLKFEGNVWPFPATQTPPGQQN